MNVLQLEISYGLKEMFFPHKRFVTPEELDSFMAYLKDKKARLLRRTGEPLTSEWFRTGLCVCA